MTEVCDQCSKSLRNEEGMISFIPVFTVRNGEERHLAFCSSECHEAYWVDAGVDWSTAKTCTYRFTDDGNLAVVVQRRRNE